MQYRKLPHGEEQIRILGLGTSSIQAADELLDAQTGIRGKKDLDRILGFLAAAEEEKDYSVVGSLAPHDASGVCVYCNHCKPCPAGLEIGLINRNLFPAQSAVCPAIQYGGKDSRKYICYGLRPDKTGQPKCRL